MMRLIYLATILLLTLVTLTLVDATSSSTTTTSDSSSPTPASASATHSHHARHRALLAAGLSSMLRQKKLQRPVNAIIEMRTIHTTERMEGDELVSTAASSNNHVAATSSSSPSTAAATSSPHRASSAHRKRPSTSNTLRPRTHASQQQPETKTDEDGASSSLSSRFRTIKKLLFATV